MFSTSTLNIRPVADPKAVVQGKQYRFTVLTERLIRMEWNEFGHFEDRATKMVLCREFPVPKFEVRETEDALEIITSALRLYYDKKPFSPTGLSVRVNGMERSRCARWFYRMPQPLLLGQETNLKGTVSTLDNVDGACELEDGLLSRMGFSAVEDNDTSVLDENGWYVPAERESGSVDLYFFCYLQDHKAALRDYYRLSGATPMLPRYALGNWWCRYYKYTEQTYMELMNRFAEKQIPLAVSVLDMDWHITQPDPKYGTGWTGFTWNREFFPDPKRMLKWLHDRGLHVSMNLHPHDGIRAFEDCYEAAATAMGIDPKTEETVHFDASDPKFMRTYLDKVLHPLEEQGVDFWWTDWQQLGGTSKSGYDPLWMLNHYLYTDNARRGTYPLTMSRYAGLGSHRYPLGFSGDTVMSWESLDFQPYFTNCASNVGYGWWTHDIGGHFRGTWSDELQVRWVQYGVFSPIFRPHSGNSTFFLKEPWTFPLNVEAVLSDFMRLRHRLIPYLYTMNYRNHAEGVPLCCPLYYDYPEVTFKNKLGDTCNNEYMFGTSLLVCPITSPLDTASQTGRVHAWIPQGTWYDIFNHRRYTGEKRMNLYRTLEQYPVLAKAGTILPLSDDPICNGAPLPEKLELRVYCGADGEFTLYEDDERLENTRIARTPLRFAWGAHARLTVGAVEGDRALVPQSRDYRVRFIGLNAPSAVEVKVNGQTVEAKYAYDAAAHCAQVVLTAVCPEDTVEILVENDGTLAENNYRAELEARLPRYQIANITKQYILDALNGTQSRAAVAAAVACVCDNENIVGEALEILTSAI